MAPLAPREIGDPGSGAPRASAASTPAAPLRSPPSTRTGPHPAPKRAADRCNSELQQRHARPGVALQNLLLHDFYCTAIPDPSYDPEDYLDLDCTRGDFNDKYNYNK
ncbi:unnamed protein product [Urochloa humidicola]